MRINILEQNAQYFKEMLPNMAKGSMVLADFKWISRMAVNRRSQEVMSRFMWAALIAAMDKCKWMHTPPQCFRMSLTSRVIQHQAPLFIPVFSPFAHLILFVLHLSTCHSIQCL